MFFDLNNSTLQLIVNVESTFEFSLGIPTFLFNIYSVIQLSRISTFNTNLKIVLAASSLATAYVALSHPILNAIPLEKYSVENRLYGFAALVYFFHYLTHSFTTMGNLKFIIIAIERRYAFSERYSYENQDNSVGKLIALVTLMSSLFFVAIKVGLFIQFPSKQKTLDEQLFAAFCFDGSIYHYSFAYCVAAFIFIYAIWEFNQQKRKVQEVRYTGRSLSERYEIKQIRDVVNLMRALLKAYFILYAVACMGLAMLIYVYFVLGCKETSLCYHVCGNIGYICLQIYNMFYVIYLTIYFPQLKYMMLKDLCFCLKKQKQVKKSVANINVVPEADHFDILKTLWTKKK